MHAARRAAAIERRRQVLISVVGHVEVAEAQAAQHCSTDQRREVAAARVRVVLPGVPEKPINEALRALKVTRTVATLVSGFATAIALARTSDLVASVPDHHTSGSRQGTVSFPLPWPVPDFLVSMMWHPRLEADLAHQWLRDRVRTACAIRQN